MDEYYVIRSLNSPATFPAAGGGSGIGNITLAQAIRQTGEGGGGSAADTVTFTAHNSGVVIVHWGHATITLTSLTVAGETVTEIGTQNDFGIQHCRMFRVDDISAGGAKVVTATWSGALSGNGWMTVLELTGTNAAALLGQEGKTSGSGTTASIALTTATDKEMGLAYVACDNQEPTIGAGYTVISLANTNLWDEAEYNLNLGSAGSKTISMSTSGNWGIKAATFKASGS